jgi:type I restriction enzyme S subunit
MKTKWPTKKLGDICVKITDGSHNPPKGVEVGFPMLSSRNIFNHGINFEGARFLTEEDFASENKRTDVEPGDVLLTIVGTIGRVIVIPKGLPKFTLQRSVAVIKTGTEIDEYYLAQYLSSPDVQEYFMSQARGGAQKGFYLKDIKDLYIPLPSLEEQKRIVKVLEEKLGKVKEAIQLRQDAIADTEKILSSKLSEIFTEGKEEGWKEKRIDEISDIKGGKRLPKGEKLTDESTPHPYIRVTDFKGGQLKEDTIKYLSEEIFDQISRYTISSNDIFVSIAGTVGLVHKIPKQYDGASLTENAAKITNIDHSVRKDYLYWLLNSDWIQNELKGRSIQTTISKLALYKIGEQKIVYPDLKTQERIVKELDELRARVAELHALQDDQLADLKSLERAYLHEAFNGELA